MGRTGGSAALLEGRNPTRRRMLPSVSMSSSQAKWATPETWLWVEAPPSRSIVTSSCVTVRMTSGPVTNM